MKKEKRNTVFSTLWRWTKRMFMGAGKELSEDDRFAVDVTGAEILSAEPGHSICEAEIRPHHLNAVNAVMGGVIFTLADFAFAVLSNQIHQLTVAQQVDIHYLSAPKGEKLIAHATCRKDGRTSSIVNVDISDDTGRDVAQFIGTGFKL